MFLLPPCVKLKKGLKMKSARTIRIDRKRKQILELNKAAKPAKPVTMLVQHVRDSKGKAFATVVATGLNKVGAAICNKKDVFRKKIGIQIAKGRAEADTKPKMRTTSSKAWKVAQAVVAMGFRSEQYFGVKTAKRGRPKGSKNKKK